MASQTLDFSQFESHLRKLGGRDLKPLLERLRTAIVSAIQERFYTSRAPDGSKWESLSFPRIGGGDLPLLDEGDLLRACTNLSGEGHFEKYSDTSFEIGTTYPPAKLHQEGGTITPKKGKFLAIPKTESAKRAGSPRNFGGHLEFRGNYAGGVLVQKMPGGQAEVVQYALAKSVTVPARPFFGWNQELIDDCTKIIMQYVQETIGRKK